MADHRDLDDLIVDHLERGVRAATPLGLPPSAAHLGARNRRRRSTLIASSAAMAIMTTVLAIEVVSGDDPVSTTPPVTSREAEPPPCVYEWDDMVLDPQTYPSIEDAVRARTGNNWEISVTGVDPGGFSVVEVTDPWGRQGVYQLAELKGGWYVQSGQGCAPYEPPGDAPGTSVESPPPCSGRWGGRVDYAGLESFETPEDAVRARTGQEWKLEIQGLDADGWMVVEVTDPWGREGTYFLDRYRDRWVVLSGIGCAPSESPTPQ